MKKETGIALIAALLVLVVVAILVMGTTFTSIIDRSISSNQRGATDAYYVAKAGVDKYKTIAFQTYRYYLANPDKYDELIKQSNHACGNYLTIGLDLNRDGVINANDLTDDENFRPWISEGNGEYRIKYDVAGRYIVLTAEGRVGRSRSTVQIVAAPSNTGLFDQALFAGPGQSGNFLNGGVEIRGSVYIEGNSVDSNALVLDSNGNFAQYNYYSRADISNLLGNTNISASDLSRFLNVNFLEQKDMCAHLRVKDGRIRLNGSATAGGSPNNPAAPDGFKTNLEGVEIDDGTEDISGINRIEADTIRGFDLSEVPPFPKLDTPYSASATNNALELDYECARINATSWRDCLHRYGEQARDTSVDADHSKGGLFVVNSNGSTQYSYTTCNPCEDPNDATDDASEVTVPYTGAGCDLTPLMSGNTVTFDDTEINCAVDLDNPADGKPDVGFSYIDTGNGEEFALTVYGVTNFKGLNVKFAKNVEARFENKASFFVEGLKADGTEYTSTPNYNTMVGGNILVDGDIIPAGCPGGASSCSAADKLTFPDDSVLGFITDNTFTVTGSNQNSNNNYKQQVVMGLIYAGNHAALTKGTVTFGSVIAPTFTFSSNQNGQKSKLYYVPGLTYGSAPGFNAIEDEPKPTFNIVSFERR